jgi:lipopolysaccharide export system protein LptA
VWTPKRVLLLLGCFAALCTVYEVYAGFLGGIDGLTPLPADYWPPEGPSTPPPPLPPRTNLADIKLQQAYGQSCPELQRTIKLDLRNRGMVLAVDEFTPQQDGRVLLQPCSLAMFGKTLGPDGIPEINALSSDVAFLTFDKPVRSPAELSGRKITDAELKGNIRIINNRKTARRDDDLSLYTQGPLYFKEDRHHIWTLAPVKLIDMQTRPKESRINAVGMDIYLATEPAKTPTATNKAKSENISGVDHITLRSWVEMHLPQSSQGGFLSNGKTADKPPAGKDPKAAPPEHTEIVINTPGPFTFNNKTYLATFDIPQRQSRYPEIVSARRRHEDTHQEDQLQCDHLELQFRPKTAPATNGKPPAAGGTPPTSASASANEPGEGLVIESAHATGKTLTLTSDVEGLDAFGNDLFYDARQQRTVLRGDPEMIALKEGNEIHAQELVLTETETKTRQAQANGPGYVGMLDRNAQGQMARTLTAHWKERLIYKKEGNLDCLTLTGDASFEDKEHGQQLRAQRLKLWLEPAEPSASASATNAPQQRLRPQHLEAKGHVTADSEELHIQDPTDELIIYFKDVPPAPDQPVAEPGKDDSKSPETLVGPTLPRIENGPPSPGPTERKGGSGKTSSAAATPGKQPAPAGAGSHPAGVPEKPKQPITLSARLVKVHIVRSGPKNDLDQLWCEGAVVVHQDPASPEEHGIDIHGDTMELHHHVDGNVLAVTGQWGQVRLDKISILGPEVNIDQRSNRAWVNGIGAMQMLSTTNLDGAKLAQPTELTIHWKEAMLFNGKHAEFRGGVQAEQDNGRLLCQEMQAAFDRPVSLKEGNKGGPQPKVDKLLCDKNVQIEDAVYEGTRLVSYKRLVAPMVDLDNADHVLTAPGPGELRILQKGDADQPGAKSPGTTPAPAAGVAVKPGAKTDPQAKPAGSKPAGASKKGSSSNADQEMKLTHVRFRERMQANQERRTAVFYGNVEVVNVPTDKPDLKIDVDHPPPGCMYLSCERLNVLSHPGPQGTSYQELEAIRKVYVQAHEFSGRADVVKYDESKELVIFEGGPGSMANLFRVKVPGTEPERIVAKRIYYWRNTGEVRYEEAQTINANN